MKRTSLSKHRVSDAVRTVQGTPTPTPEGQPGDFLNSLDETEWMPANCISALRRIAQAPPSGELGCNALLHSWYVAGPGRNASAALAFLSLPTIGTCILAWNPCHSPVGTLRYRFCLRLGERKGLARGHIEPRTFLPPNSSHLASFHECPWLWPADHLFA